MSAAGDKCPCDGCDGIIKNALGSCTCFMGHAPCSACESGSTYCPKCGWDQQQEEEEDELIERETAAAAEQLTAEEWDRVDDILHYFED